MGPTCASIASPGSLSRPQLSGISFVIPSQERPGTQQGAHEELYPPPPLSLAVCSPAWRPHDQGAARVRVEPKAGPGKARLPKRRTAPSPRSTGPWRTGCSRAPVTGGSARTPRLLFRVRSQRGVQVRRRRAEERFFCLNSKVSARLTRMCDLFFLFFFSGCSFVFVRSQPCIPRSQGPKLASRPSPPKGVRSAQRQVGAKHPGLSGPPCEHGCTVSITNHGVWVYLRDRPR